MAAPGLGAVLKAFALALVLYALVASASASLVEPKSAQALALGAILIFGVAYLVAQGLADAAPRALTRRTALASATAALAYFALPGRRQAVGARLPAPPVPGALEWALIVLALALLRHGGRGPGTVPALGASPGRRRPAGPSGQWPLSECLARPPDRRLPRARTPC